MDRTPSWKVQPRVYHFDCSMLVPLGKVEVRDVFLILNVCWFALEVLLIPGRPSSGVLHAAAIIVISELA